MMYPFLQIDGDTEIVHSDMLPNGEVKVYIEYIEKTDAKMDSITPPVFSRRTAGRMLMASLPRRLLGIRK